MWTGSQTCFCLLLTLAFVNGDLYLHNPRGSNNRLNENRNNRRNANRIFDSQNNGKGGYNVGDATSKPFGRDADKQYQMKYFQSGSDIKTSPSVLSIEWTNQHGCCGVDPKLRKNNCNLVLQFMCQPIDGSVSKIDKIRAGVRTSKQVYWHKRRQFNSLKQQEKQKKRNVKSKRGLHESWEWYDRCVYRENNNGLFTADQRLSKIRVKRRVRYSRAIHTRQNRKGRRFGYECPEERDYYPYWHPTPWIDIAVLTDDKAMCTKYRNGSYNHRPYEECVEAIANGNEWIRRSRWNNKNQCVLNGGKWLTFHNFLEKAPEFTDENSCKAAGSRYIWGLPSDTKDITKYECLVSAPPLLCVKAPYSRVNHLGNGLSGQANTFEWTLPNFQSGKEQRCVLRMRYNITTNDYDPSKTDASHNGKHVTNNPTVNVGGVPLRLAINTAQFGRTFEDRSHDFILRPRPDGVEGRILNLNVRGKRGNIVQTYPGVEYDFTPNRLEIVTSDLVHIQWTGSNTNPRRNDGEGKKGTDRSNIVQMKTLSESYPLSLQNATMWDGSEVIWIHHGETGVSSVDLAIDMASAGYYSCLKAASCPESLVTNAVDKKAAMNELLNNAPASYEGALLRFKEGIYYYMCTRNNNFTNRSQKGMLSVDNK